MSSRNVIEFLRMLATQADLLEHLKVKSKDEVITTAAQLGFPFTVPEWDSLIWDLEDHLADKRGEKFDTAHFMLFHTMWGKYYLEFLVTDMIPSLAEADFDVVMTAEEKSR
ncbi:MAG: Nif11-like leader peptide family natural product precursor [Actinomycetota bacterium]|nr:Nif11-like leader peptide family natural product precursor [Actinomycetota bacterium]